MPCQIGKFKEWVFSSHFYALRKAGIESTRRRQSKPTKSPLEEVTVKINSLEHEMNKKLDGLLKKISDLQNK